MGVIPFRAADVKALELATADVIGHYLNPFPQLYAANHDAYSRSYDERRPLTPAELALKVTEYDQTPPTPGKAALTTSELLDQLHQLTYNCLTNNGEYTVSAPAEAARRYVMQAVAFECVTMGGPLVRVAEFLYIQRQPAHDCAYILTFFTTEDPQQPYAGEVPSLNEQARFMHGQTYQEGELATAFRTYWQLHDDLSAQATAEYEAALYAEAVRLGIVSPPAPEAAATYRTHTADRDAGQRWLTVLIHPDGRYADHHEHPKALAWTVAPSTSGDLQPGDVVTCCVTARFKTTQELLFFVGQTADGHAVAMRSIPANDLEVYYVLTLAQLARVYRPQRRYTVLQNDQPHFQPWQTVHERALVWLPEVAAPYTLNQPYENGSGVVLRIVGTDVCTGQLILKPEDPDLQPVTFSMTPEELGQLRAI